MSGHSKWSTIKHRKGAQDAKRGKIFTKVIKEITVAARLGGGDPEANPRLRAAMLQAKSVNMPSDNVNKAIKKGTGELQAESYETLVYEGYGPHNVAVIVECLTDNRNRTISSVRSIFNKNSGNIGATNSVMYMFDRVGLIEVEKSTIDEDALTEIVLDSGAEDIDASQEEIFEITTAMDTLFAVSSFLEEKGVKVSKAELALIPQNKLEITDTGKAEQILKFLDLLEDDEDVQNVFTNLDISDEVMVNLGQG